MGRKAKIITVSGGKGGTGKSFVSVNLSVELARSLSTGMRRLEMGLNNRVLLFDADYHMANSHIFFGVRQASYLDRIIESPEDIMTYIKATEYGVDLISFGGDDKKVNNTYGFNDEILRELQKLEEFYDWIIVDTGAGLTEMIVKQILFADSVLLVMNPEPTSLLDTYKQIKLISRQKDSPGVFFVCVNRVRSIKEGRDTFFHLQKNLERFGVKAKLELAGVVHADKKNFDTSMVYGVPAVLSERAPHFSRSFKTLRETLCMGGLARRADSFFRKIFS